MWDTFLSNCHYEMSLDAYRERQMFPVILVPVAAAHLPLIGPAFRFGLDFFNSDP